MAVVVPVPCAERGCSILYADLKAPAVELDLMDPVRAIGRTVDQEAGRECDEVGERGVTTCVRLS